MACTLLLGCPPESVSVGMWHADIETDFRVGVAFELLMQREDIPPEEKAGAALELYYHHIPQPVELAFEKMLWFYRCGKPDEDEDKEKTGGRYKKPYDFEQDEDMLTAAFWRYYGIDLTRDSLHWWTFRALMRGLPPECEFIQAVRYRTGDTKGMKPEERKHFLKMRKLYELKNGASVHTVISLQERDRQMKEYVARRIAETRGGGSNGG